MFHTLPLTDRKKIYIYIYNSQTRGCYDIVKAAFTVLLILFKRLSLRNGVLFFYFTPPVAELLPLSSPN